MRHLATVVISGAPPIAQAGRCTISGTRQTAKCTIEYAPNIGFLDVGEQLRNAAKQLVDIWFEHNSIFPGLTFTLTRQANGDWNIEIDVAAAPAAAVTSTSSASGWEQDSEFDLDDLEPAAGSSGYAQAQPSSAPPPPPGSARGLGGPPPGFGAPPPVPGSPPPGPAGPTPGYSSPPPGPGSQPPGYPPGPGSPAPGYGSPPPVPGGPPQPPGVYQDRGAPPMPNSGAPIPGGLAGNQPPGGFQSPGAPGGFQQQGGFQPPGSPVARGAFLDDDEFQPIGQGQQTGGLQSSGYQSGGYQSTGFANPDSQQGVSGNDDGYSNDNDQFEALADSGRNGSSSERESPDDGQSPRKPRRGAARGGMVSTGPQANPKTIKTIIIGVLSVILLAGAGTGLFFLLSQKKAVRPPKTFEETRKDFETNLTRRAEAPQEFDNAAPEQVKVVEYESGDRKLMAWLVLPDREPPFPAVVFAHDGFALSRADYTNAVPFVSHGFAVLIPSWRGENGNPGDFEMCYGEVDDLVAAIDYMATRKKIDKGSIFAAGQGVGATSVMLAAELSPHLRKAAACGGRPDMFEAGEAYEHAPFDQRNAEERLMRSPQQFVDDLKCPLLLLYGDKDPGHKFFKEQAEKMSKDSKKFPVLVEEIEGATHQTALAPAIQRMITFFNAR